MPTHPFTSVTQVRSLPDNPSLDHLKGQARTLQKAARAGDRAALEMVAAFESRSSNPTPDNSFALTAAQLTVARNYGFPSWARMREHLQVIDDFTRWPEPVPDDAPEPSDPAGLVDHFLRLAVLNYTGDGTPALDRARDLLSRHPELAMANAFTMAATGAHEPLQRLLGEDPAAATRQGGPLDWEPLLYLAYARLGDGPGRTAAETARVLLAAGADPNAGYLWGGMTSPFTALTGVFGRGESDQPVHHDSVTLARMLLEAGADPNDNQGLYNRMFRPDNDHLELLFEFGLGTEVESPWRDRLGRAYPSPEEMVTEQLRFAADRGHVDRVRLLLERGVDPDGQGYHPIFRGQLSNRLAVLAGHHDIAELLAAAGADTSSVDDIDAFLGSAMAADRASVDTLVAADAALSTAARRRSPSAVAKAADQGHLEAVRLLLDLGFDPDDGGHPRRTGLHLAAIEGRTEIVRLLLERGADPTVTDRSYGTASWRWAEVGGHPELADLLRDAAENP